METDACIYKTKIEKINESEQNGKAFGTVMEEKKTRLV